MCTCTSALRRRILRAFVGRGLLESFEAKEMLAYQHSGFSVNTSVCIEGQDRAGLERLLRYCARPPFAMDRLRKEGAALVYRCAKQHSEPTIDKRGAKVDELAIMVDVLAPITSGSDVVEGISEFKTQRAGHARILAGI